MSNADDDYISPVLRCIHRGKEYARLLRRGGLSAEEVRETVMTTISEAIREDDEASRRAVTGMVERAIAEVLAEPSDHPDTSDTHPRFPINWGPN